MRKVTIVDAGIGNLPSLMSAFLRVDAEVIIAETPINLNDADLVVLPGVGHWTPAAKRLQETGWDQEIRSHALRGKPLLGICLGMQLLGVTSEEGEGTGLSLIPMTTVANPETTGRRENLGWNRVTVAKRLESWMGIEDGRSFYFTHKFSVAPSSTEFEAIGSIDFPGVVAGVQSGNVIGVQFHPERSGKSGIDFLSCVIDWAAQ